MYAITGTPLPRSQMLDGFNEGWLRFEAGQADTTKGKLTLEQTPAKLTGEPA